MLAAWEAPGCEGEGKVRSEEERRPPPVAIKYEREWEDYKCGRGPRGSGSRRSDEPLGWAWRGAVWGAEGRLRLGNDGTIHSHSLLLQ